MVQTNQQQTQTRAIKRTLCIGMGGTGRDTLMRIRRLIIERHGKLSNLPVVSFLSIDTDEGCLNTTGLTNDTYRGESLLFEPAEQVAITMSTQDVEKLVHELEHKSLFGDGPFSHIEEWFPPILKDNVKVIIGGANGIRPIGRLGFVHNFQKIQSAIKKAEYRTIDHEAFLLQQGLNVEPGLDIFVVGSLCGGTGSGTFLDIAYTLRYLYQTNTELFGYLVISPELYGNDNTMQANVYAALKELNYYSKTGTEFRTCYDKHNQIYVADKKPPFTYPYLVSNQAGGNHKILTKGKLCNVIAHKIYLEIAGEAKSNLTFKRSGIIPDMLKTDLHPFRMPQYYLTFGLSAIYFTRDRFLQIALNRLTRTLLQFWLTGEGQSPDAQELLDRFLGKWNIENNQEVFTVKLAEFTHEDNKTYAQYLNLWKQRTQDIECKNSEDIEQFCQSLPNTFKKEFRKVQPGPTETTRGAWLTLLYNNQVKVSEKLKGDIDQFIATLLNADDTDFSVYNVLQFLEALRTKLSQYQRQLEEKKQELKGMYTQEKIEQAWEDADQEIEDIQGRSKLPWFKSRNYLKIQEIMIDSVAIVSKLLQHNYDVFLQVEAIKIAESLQDHVALRINQITKLDNTFQSLLNFYKKKEEQLLSLNLDEMSGEAIFPEEEIDQLLPRNGSRQQLSSITNDIELELGIPSSLFSLASTNISSENTLQKNIDLIFERRSSSLNWQQMQSVVQRFMTTYSDDKRAMALEQVRRKATPLLDIHRKDPLFMDGKDTSFIAFKYSDDTENELFRDILTKKIGVPTGVMFPVQTDEEILFVNEYGGFPLRVINHLHPLKLVYNKRKSFGDLHNHYQIQFDDIIPVDAREIESLEYIFYPCLAFNLLNYNSQTDLYEFPCYDSLRRTHYTATLSSDWKNAIEQLVERQDMVDIIKQLLEQEENKIKANPGLMNSDYQFRINNLIRQVDQLDEGDRNFIYKDKVIGTRSTLDQPAKEGIISRYINKLKGKLEDEPLPGGGIVPTSIDSNQGILPPTLNNDSPESAIVKSSDNPRLSELERLANLKNQGMLTEEEFQKEKARILSSKN